MPPPAAVTQCGLPAPDMALGPDSFTELWRSSTLGLTGGDAAYSVRLPDGRELWVFGDSFIGELRPDGTRPPDEATVVRNTLVIEDGHCLTTLFRWWHGEKSAYLAGRENPYSEWFWPNQPFVRNGELLMFLTHLHRTGPSGWGFAADGSALARLSLPGLAVKRIERVRTAAGTYFGVATADYRGDTYVFGVDERVPSTPGLLVARLPGGNLTAGGWSYWDGSAWSDNARAARPVLGLPSNSFSVIARRDGLVLASQEALRPAVLGFAAHSPTGPWRPAESMGVVPSLDGLMTYNAMLHPEFSSHGVVLMSYCVNSKANSLDSVNERPQDYLPRFTTAMLPG